MLEPLTITLKPLLQEELLNLSMPISLLLRSTQ
nr:MAG TPA: hypothetical protein [Caudoviricetes sp.]